MIRTAASGLFAGIVAGVLVAVAGLALLAVLLPLPPARHAALGPPPAEPAQVPEAAAFPSAPDAAPAMPAAEQPPAAATGPAAGPQPAEPDATPASREDPELPPAEVGPEPLAPAEPAPAPTLEEGALGGDVPPVVAELPAALRQPAAAAGVPTETDAAGRDPASVPALAAAPDAGAPAAAGESPPARAVVPEVTQAVPPASPAAPVGADMAAGAVGTTSAATAVPAPAQPPAGSDAVTAQDAPPGPAPVAMAPAVPAVPSPVPAPPQGEALVTAAPPSAAASEPAAPVDGRVAPPADAASPVALAPNDSAPAEAGQPHRAEALPRPTDPLPQPAPAPRPGLAEAPQAPESRLAAASAPLPAADQPAPRIGTAVARPEIAADGPEAAPEAGDAASRPSRLASADPSGLAAPVTDGSPPAVPAPPAALPRDAARSAPILPPAATGESMVPEPDAPPAAIAKAPEPTTPDPQMRPRAGFSGGVPGVRVNRLPTIGGDQGTEIAAAEEASQDAAGDAPVLPETALERNAAAFENPEMLPLMAVIIVDEDADPTTRAAMTRLSFPVTFAIDPLRPDAAEAADFYRAQGHEVLVLASGIPEGAAPRDIEVTFAAYFGALPQAVGVVDLPDGGFQNNRLLAQQVTTILRAEGFGLVTYERGLNPADQVARSEGLPAGRVFRVLDAEDENPPTIRRYLDRAAFRAAQEGHVIVLGRSRADTVAGLLEWRLEGRAASVALAPVSAVLSR